MSTFVDTSALLGLLDASEEHHSACAQTWARLLDGDETLVTSSYVLVEFMALVQRRFGLAAVRRVDDDLLPVIDVEWVGESDHRAGVTMLLTSKRRKLSLVDCVSFVVMKRLGTRRAFALDRHFRQTGIEVLPR